MPGSSFSNLSSLTAIPGAAKRIREALVQVTEQVSGRAAFVLKPWTLSAH